MSKEQKLIMEGWRDFLSAANNTFWTVYGSTP